MFTTFPVEPKLLICESVAKKIRGRASRY